MFNQETLFYFVSSLVMARLTIETLVTERNDLSPLCAVGKSITDLELFEKNLTELLGLELESDYAKLVKTELTSGWHDLRSVYLNPNKQAQTSHSLAFLSAMIATGLFNLSVLEGQIAKMNNAAINDIVSFSKNTFQTVSEELFKAGQTYFAR